MKNKLLSILFAILLVCTSLSLFGCGEPAKYTISFMVDGSTYQTATVEEGNAITQPTLKPTKSGYVFDGWDYDFTQIPTGDVTINAKWTEITLSLDKTEATLNVISTPTVQLTATVAPTGLSVNWSSSATSVATVDNTGLVTAVAAGTATITASCNGKTATCAVTVEAPADYYVMAAASNKDVVKDPGKWYFYSSNKSGLNGYYANGEAHLNVTATTSSDYYLRYQPENIKVGYKYTATATITLEQAAWVRLGAGGKTTMVECVAGENTITWTERTASADGPLSIALCNTNSDKDYMSGPYTVVVSNVVATPIFEITPSEKLVQLSDSTIQLTTNLDATKFPEGTAIAWSSSDSEIATVDSATGLVSFVKGGEVTITATYETLTATCVLTINDTIVTFANKEVTIDRIEGSTATVTATATKGGEAQTGITYTSSDPETATVDSESGLVTALKDGVVTITATCNGVSDTCTVTIVSATVTFASKTATIDMDTETTVTVSATVTPSGTITYSSSDTAVATVDPESGLVTALKVGEVTITATCGTATDTCVVTITGTTVTFDKTEIIANMTESETVQLNATASNSGTATFESSDDTIATVDGTGLVTLLKTGKVTITATCGKATDTCTIYVVDDASKIATTQTELVSGNATKIAANPGTWYYNDSNNVAVSTYAMADGVMTLTSLGENTKTSQLRYLPESLDAGVSANYVLVVTIKNSAETANASGDLTYKASVNGHASDILASGTIGLGKEETIVVNFTIVGGASTTEFLNLKLNNFGAGNVTVSDMYLVKLS